VDVGKTNANTAMFVMVFGGKRLWKEESRTVHVIILRVNQCFLKILYYRFDK